MTEYTEKTDRYVTLGPNGEKSIKDIVHLMDGEEIVFTKKPNRITYEPDADVPQDVADFIEEKKVKQPKK